MIAKFCVQCLRLAASRISFPFVLIANNSLVGALYHYFGKLSAFKNLLRKAKCSQKSPRELLLVECQPPLHRKEKNYW